ncbi:hypothetical protein AX769_05910 [Frondihabitans sp. PAMC 28766]|uniref:hypothetical protein n=1 Tax=Frondihabitans sp. PAMC 28766 TaxID=1795630 RepID=UPI00078B36C5|nr:hypothetical protein [Frondihabitans sp. PAMC 28766]AMM19770.1 hypothetical protein AX769_05910 [Frondihabitans sp. PAMC 28766]
MAATSDRTPRFAVDWKEDSHIGASLVIRSASTQAVLCRGEKPATGDDSYHYAGCTSSPLPLGVTNVEAVFVSADGKHETKPSAVRVHVVPQHLDIEVTAYDKKRDVVSLEGTGPATETVRVGQDLSTDFGGLGKDVKVSDDGTWATMIEHPLDHGFEVEYDCAGQEFSGGAYFTKNAPLKPTETHRLEGSQIVVEVRSDATTDRVEIRDEMDRVVASAPRTGDITTLSFNAPAAEARFRVQASHQGAHSSSGWFVVKEGIGHRVSDAPEVEDVQRTGSRAVVTASALPGAVVTIRNDKGAVVATHLAGTNGRAQLAMTVPPASKAGTEFLITQSMNGAQSDRDDFELPKA